MPGSVATDFRGRRRDPSASAGASPATSSDDHDNITGGEAAGADWKIAPEDVADLVIDLVTFPSRSLPSRIELRPSRPKK